MFAVGRGIKMTHIVFALVFMWGSSLAHAAEEASWMDGLSGNVFVDAFYMRDWNAPTDPQSTKNAARWLLQWSGE